MSEFLNFFTPQQWIALALAVPFVALMWSLRRYVD